MVFYTKQINLLRGITTETENQSKIEKKKYSALAPKAQVPKITNTLKLKREQERCIKNVLSRENFWS